MDVSVNKSLLFLCFFTALGQIMLYVDGMNGVIGHNETVQWLYTLVGSKVQVGCRPACNTFARTARPLYVLTFCISHKFCSLFIQLSPYWNNLGKSADSQTEELVPKDSLVTVQLPNSRSIRHPGSGTFTDAPVALEMPAVSHRVHMQHKGILRAPPRGARRMHGSPFYPGFLHCS